MAQRRERLDKRVLAEGLAPDIRIAAGLVMRGDVLVNDKPVTSAGTLIKERDVVTLKTKAVTHPWASRGGLKLDYALGAFDISVKNAVAIDVGASTGGFTDVLLHRGARRVFAVDVAYNELAWKLRNDSRVTALDRVNARHLSSEHIDETPDIVVCDVSFISIKRALPPAISTLRQNGLLVTLVKPQFEAPREYSDAGGGVIHDASVRRDVCLDACNWATSENLNVVGMCRSPVTGRKGNVEYLMLAVKR